LPAALPFFMATDAAAMKRGAGIRHGGRGGPMTLPAGILHLRSCRGVMTDYAAPLFVHDVTAMLEGYGTGARRQLDGGSGYAGREQCKPQENTQDHRSEAHQFFCQASKNASASSAVTVNATIARAIHKRIVVAPQTQSKISTTASIGCGPQT
jgi:hypothetical protein